MNWTFGFYLYRIALTSSTVGQRSHEAVRWHFGQAEEDLVTDKEDIEVEEANEESSNEDEGDDEARTSDIA
ncbi:hypothetical protein ACH5RR_021446 [Cinchona calisaya]|uniref:Uncharacterized protein n=1 Tax=Cinchona calisaya TaxID=153742 RepID=A0ABD2ZK67_9GENT